MKGNSRNRNGPVYETGPFPNNFPCQQEVTCFHLNSITVNSVGQIIIEANGMSAGLIEGRHDVITDYPY